MRVVLQRVKKSSVTVNNEVIGQINHGLMVLVGVKCGDTTKDADELVGKIVKLRIFDDENGVMNKSIVDSGGDILTVSNFTLYADCKKGVDLHIQHQPRSKKQKCYMIISTAL